LLFHFPNGLNCATESTSDLAQDKPSLAMFRIERFLGVARVFSESFQGDSVCLKLSNPFFKLYNPGPGPSQFLFAVVHY